MGKLASPKERAVFYEDEKVYACLANDNRVDGHSIVAWKKEHVEDISHLAQGDYKYLMHAVNVVRNALLQHYKTDKVYTAYLDETGDVHWQLFPRQKGGKMGFELMCEPKRELTDLSAVPFLRSKCLALMGR